MRLERTVDPASAPISLDEAREWIAMQTGITDDDDLLSDLIDEVTDEVEAYTGRALVEQTWKIVLDADEALDTIYLPKAPLVSVSSVTTWSSDGISSTVDAGDYQVSGGELARVALAEGVSSWASDLRSYDALEIVAVFGYATIPPRIKRLLKGLVLHAYMTKGIGVMEFASGQLMSIPQQYRQQLRNLRLRVAL